MKTSPESVGRTGRSSLNRARVLLVDDDEGVRGNLSNLLVSEGYVVLPARHGAEALQLMEATDVDLVVMDLNMPVMNGWDAFEHLSRNYPLTPVMIVTARSNQFFTALGSGAAALLEKPLEIPVFLSTIGRLLDEPAEARLARVAGQPAPFTYSQGQPPTP